MVVNSTEALGDFEAMIQALGQVGDPGHLAVIGAQSGADLALAGCAADTLCKALVLLTPTNHQIAQNTNHPLQPAPDLSRRRAERQRQLWHRRIFARLGARRDWLRRGRWHRRTGAALLQASPTLGDQMIEWLGKELNT